MTLNGQNALWKKSFSRAHQKNVNEDRHILSAAKCGSMILVSRNIRHMRIFAGGPREGAPDDSGVVDCSMAVSVQTRSDPKNSTETLDISIAWLYVEWLFHHRQTNWLIYVPAMQFRLRGSISEGSTFKDNDCVKVINVDPLLSSAERNNSSFWKY